MKVAFIHDWLDTYRGGEKVLEALITLFPDAPIYTLFYNSRELPSSITQRQIIYPKKWQILQRYRKLLLPLLPSIIQSFRFDGFDLLISTSSCVAKSIRTQGIPHISYIHSPMRYIWDQKDHYFSAYDKNPVTRYLVARMIERLRKFDQNSNDDITRIIVNSSFVQKRVRDYYNRDSSVVHPPIALDQFRPTKNKGDFFLVAGALVPYKRVDLAIEACRLLSRPLVIAGSGPEERKLRKMASGQNVRFLGKLGDEAWAQTLAEAQALLFPGVEDFGMVPIEAMASGTPVIALAKGGALDYVEDGVNGLLFSEETPESLAKALERFAGTSISSTSCVHHAQKFSHKAFLERFSSILKEVYP